VQSLSDSGSALWEILQLFILVAILRSAVMSQVESAAGHSLDDGTEELSTPSSGISRADTLPDLADAHAECLHKLQVSDGDFHTKAKVNGELFRDSNLHQD
jgi:hypothetical protein